MKTLNKFNDLFVIYAFLAKMLNSVADPGFPREARQPLGGGESTYYLANFSLKTA